MNDYQAGFTIIEIALVFIVISLLIGGVLKGQQMIHVSQLHHLIDQSSGVHEAYYEFIDRFQTIPGDMSCSDAVAKIGTQVSSDNCSSSNIGGNEDGHIENLVEASAVWAHLSASQFLKGSYAGNAATVDAYKAGVTNGNIPANGFQGPILLAHMSNYIDGNATTVTKRLAYSYGANIPVPLLRDLDQKLDDGLPDTGTVRSVSTASPTTTSLIEGVVEYTTTAGTDDCLNKTDPVSWDVDSDNQSCNAIYLY